MNKLTQRAMADALMDLLKSRPLDKISVKDITGACGLSRNTFYYHYHDVYELLRWIFEEKTGEIMKKYQEENDWKGGLEETLDYFYENRILIGHIYESISDDLLLRFINDVMMQHARVIVRGQIQDGDFDEEVIEIAARTYMGAAVADVMGWIRTGMKESPDYKALVYNIIFLGTIDSLLKSAEEVCRIRAGS